MVYLKQFLRPSLSLKSFLLAAAVVWVFSGCATHPTIGPERLAKGETSYGYTLSIENVVPYMWFRYGLNEISDIGLRVGLPLYGTGIDYSRILYMRDTKQSRRWDVLNLAVSLNPNYNMDLTYYKMKVYRDRYRWWGIRGMYIPKGIMGNTSSRLGLLYGRQIKEKMGFEIGYYHDFSSMPITSVLDTGWKYNSVDNIARYGDTPHVSDAGIPSEYSRVTGLSILVYFQLGGSKEE